jgi:hypothetical protein
MLDAAFSPALNCFVSISIDVPWREAETSSRTELLLHKFCFSIRLFANFLHKFLSSKRICWLSKNEVKLLENGHMDVAISEIRWLNDALLRSVKLMESDRSSANEESTK